MSGKESVRVHLHGLGAEVVERAMWCDRCALPSAVHARVLLGVEGPLGLGMISIDVARYCLDCGVWETVS